jgi:PD-(D/E)XK nuclease superfamily
VDSPRIALHLARHADTAWRQVIRPWLQDGHGRLERSCVVVPTRGQAHALKQRCLVEGVPLLGVEFLTPGLARKKWLAAAGTGQPVLGRELLLLGLRALIERRLAPLRPEDALWGFWKSLQSDPERALDDFDELLKAGFRAESFPLAPLREIFAELTAWVGALGYALAPVQSEHAALTRMTSGEPPIAGRVLVAGLGPEAWGEFFNVAALVRRCAALTVVLPEPEFRGAKALDENWVALWATLLGVEPQPLDAPEPAETCAPVAALWTGEGGSAARARILVGHTRADEMVLVAAELERLLAGGAENVAVIFPRADAAHLRLARLLGARGVPVADLLETAGAPPVDLLLQRALLAFYQRGARLEELLELWPLLHSLNFVDQPPNVARDVCERIFDEGQTHGLVAYADLLAKDERAAWREVGRIAALLLPPWPAELTLADALARFAAVGEKLHLAPPAGWPALGSFAVREAGPLPARVIFAALASFLPEKSPATGAPGRSGFARVTLTTHRRAAGVAWSHLVFVESNAGIWPERREATCWLTDEQRRTLTATGRFSLGLFTSDDRAALEKQLCTGLARDTSGQIVFSAALFDEEEPEIRLAPNAWLERVLFAHCRAENRECRLEEEFACRARMAPGRPAPVSGHWDETWRRRRDPAAPFDEFFLAGPPVVTRPAWLAARQIERGAQDPAELWFEAVLGLRRMDWEPLTRARKKSLGQLAHRLLAEALRGAPAEGKFMVKPAPADAQAKLDTALAKLRERWPRDRYWDSFHGELGEIAGVLLEKVFALAAGEFVAVEAALPPGATIALGDAGSIAVHGRMDLVLLDRPAWAGAQVDIVDFKTGADAKLSAERMARGASLQLGVYLAAAESLGAAGGKVWMLKPEAGTPPAVTMDELPQALAALAQLGRHLATGCYGALTVDRTEFSHGYEWPLACPPVRHAVLTKKFAATFAVAATEEETPDE